MLYVLALKYICIGLISPYNQIGSPTDTGLAQSLLNILIWLLVVYLVG